jgi:hypothetical protein
VPWRTRVAPSDVPESFVGSRLSTRCTIIQSPSYVALFGNQNFPVPLVGACRFTRNVGIHPLENLQVDILYIKIHVVDLPCK